MKVHNTDIKIRIHESTRRLLMTRGLKGWNMDDLSAEAGIAKNTLYKIIGSKEKLIREVVFLKYKNNLEKINVQLKEPVPDNERINVFKSALDSLAELISGFEKRAFPEIFREYPALEKKGLSVKKSFSKGMIDYIVDCQNDGILKNEIDPASMLDMVMGILEWYLHKDLSDAEFLNATKNAFDAVIFGVFKE